MPKVSILVPVYNVEKYLQECLDSLKNQILDDIEIICINDGSKDGSLKILEKFAAEDQRFIIVNKENTGYGDSMNLGLAKATGEYIGILEPDDYADPEMYIELYSLAKKYRADLARSNYYELRNGENKLKQLFIPDDTGFVLDPLENTRIFYEQPAIWSAIYRREFLLEQKINFLPTPGAAFQDTSFNFKTLASGGKIVLSDKAYVHYRKDNEHASVKSTDKTYCVNEEYAEIERFLKERGTFQTYVYIFEAVKFAAYHWNMLRLPDPELEKYVLRLRAEFHDADCHGYLKKPYFPHKHYRALRTILDFPPSVFLSVFRAYRGRKRKGL